jgi:hypothetical protein
MEPRKVIGSVDTSEFLVALAASAGFLVGLGSHGIDFGVVAVLLAGGLIAAPLAAWLVQRVTARLLGASVGGLIVVTNVRTILSTVGAGDEARLAVYAVLGAAWVAALALVVRRHRRERIPLFDPARPAPDAA